MQGEDERKQPREIKYKMILEESKKLHKEYQRSTTGKHRAVQNKTVKLRMRAKTSKRQMNKEQQKETPRKTRAAQEEQHAIWVQRKRHQKEKLMPQR